MKENKEGREKTGKEKDHDPWKQIQRVENRQSDKEKKGEEPASRAEAAEGEKKLKVVPRGDRQPEVRVLPEEEEKLKSSPAKQPQKTAFTPKEQEQQQKASTTTEEKEIDVELDVQKDKVDIGASRSSNNPAGEDKDIDVNVSVNKNELHINISMQSPQTEEEEQKKKKKKKNDVEKE